MQADNLLEINNLAAFIPHTIEGTGLNFEFLADLTLKAVYADTGCTTERAAEKLRLPTIITESILQHLYHEKLLDIKGMVGFQNYRYTMLERGWERVRRLLEVNGYIGPAPVSLSSYTSMVQWQERIRERIEPEAVRAALSELVLSESTIQTLGVVVNSRRSLFLSGPTGNGKTSMAKALHAAFAGEIWIPYAIEVDGQIIRIFDSHCHMPVRPQPSTRHDRRWIKIKRPLVIAGGELTTDAMDLTYNPAIRYYEAPFQMKANGGTLIIDDFGRQRVNPRDILDRWIIPLEERVDYLTLHTGKKIQVPFDQLLIFATNLNPSDLVDDAFLRRLGYRLRIDPPDIDTYSRIFERYAADKGFDSDSKLLADLIELYQSENRQMRCCEPRDLIERCLDICRYEQRSKLLNAELLRLAWKNYFGIDPTNTH